jgi:excisionase family DNA binding protein
VQAELGDISRTTVYELIKSGDLVKVNIGRRGFITRASLEAYVDRLSRAATTGAAPSR